MSEEKTPPADGSTRDEVHQPRQDEDQLADIDARVNRALKPGGLLLASFPGGETLRELRHEQKAR